MHQDHASLWKSRMEGMWQPGQEELGCPGLGPRSLQTPRLRSSSSCHRSPGLSLICLGMATCLPNLSPVLLALYQPSRHLLKSLLVVES